MATEDTNNANGGGESVSSYYASELFNFHLDDGKAVGNKGKMKGSGGDAPSTPPATPAGQVASAMGTAMGVFGEVMSLGTQASEALLLPMMSAMKGLQGIAGLPMAKHLDPVDQRPDQPHFQTAMRNHPSIA